MRLSRVVIGQQFLWVLEVGNCIDQNEYPAIIANEGANLKTDWREVTECEGSDCLLRLDGYHVSFIFIAD
jgi:hypothetical protein